MSTYQQLIRRVTKCSAAEAIQVEDLMRNVVFHATLDWQTREELEKAARMALIVVRNTPTEDEE